MGKLVGWIVAAILLLAGTGVLIWGMGQRMVADDLRARLERADGTINALKENLEAMGRRVDAAAQEKVRFQRDVKDTRSRIIEMERSDDPDKEEQLRELNSRLSSLTTSLLDATNAEPELAAQLPGLQNQAQALLGIERIGRAVQLIHQDSGHAG